MDTKNLLNLLDDVEIPETIVRIMKDGNYEDSLCKRGVELLLTHGWKANNFLELLEQSNNPESLFKACIAFITLEGKDRNEIFKFLEVNNYHPWSAGLAVNALSLRSLSQEDLIFLLEKFDQEEIYVICQPFINLNEKNEEELAFLLERLGSGYNAKKMIAPYLKTKKNLIPIIKILDRIEDEDNLAKICFGKLGLEKLSDNELISIIKEAKDCFDLCLEITNHFKLQSSLWWVLAYYDYSAFFSAHVIQMMDDENLIMIVVEKNIAYPDVIIAAIPKLTEPNLMMVWERNLYMKEIYPAIAANLSLVGKTEDELAEFIAKEKKGNIICEACKPYLDLVRIASSVDNMVEFLKKTDFHKNACQTFLPLLKPENLSESEIFTIIQKTNANDNVCASLMQYIVSEKYILKIVKNKMYFDNDFWMQPLSRVLVGKSDSEVLEIVISLSGFFKVCKIAVDFLKSKEALTEICICSNYNADILKAAKAIIKKM